jgi:hypothetical protein
MMKGYHKRQPPSATTTCAGTTPSEDVFLKKKLAEQASHHQQAALGFCGFEGSESFDYNPMESIQNTQSAEKTMQQEKVKKRKRKAVTKEFAEDQVKTEESPIQALPPKKKRRKNECGVGVTKEALGSSQKE